MISIATCICAGRLLLCMCAMTPQSSMDTSILWKQGGFSEHAVFVKYLRSRPVRSGPASSGPGKRKRKFQHPKPKRSVALRVMLRAPASQTTVPEKGPSIEPDHDEAEEMWSVLCAPSPWMDCAW